VRYSDSSTVKLIILCGLCTKFTIRTQFHNLEVCPNVSSPKLLNGYRLNLVLGSTLRDAGWINIILLYIGSIHPVPYYSIIQNLMHCLQIRLTIHNRKSVFNLEYTNVPNTFFASSQISMALTLICCWWRFCSEIAPWSIILEKLIVTQLVKKFLAFYETRR
jgi:hypothetical protein